MNEIVIYFILLMSCLFMILINRKSEDLLNSYFLLIQIVFLLGLCSTEFDIKYEEMLSVVLIILVVCFNKILKIDYDD